MNKLKELRKEKKLTQKDLAQLLNVAPTTYLGYEKGLNEPTIETLCKLADYYQVSLDYLVGRDFGNDLGYLTSQQYETINYYLQLNHDDQLVIRGRILALYEAHT